VVLAAIRQPLIYCIYNISHLKQKGKKKKSVTPEIMERKEGNAPGAKRMLKPFSVCILTFFELKFNTRGDKKGCYKAFVFTLSER
jgi:hypothetical protein